MTVETQATAASSGAGATARFRENKHLAAATSQERVSALAGRVIKAINDTVIDEKVTYPEYDALKAWLIQVGADGEWPLFLDVFVEHVVEEVVNENRQGSKGTIEGPFYVPGAPSRRARAPSRCAPTRQVRRWSSRDRSATSTATRSPARTVELWHADDAGFYSQFAPGLPEWNLRGIVIADADGRFRFNTVQPAPYQIPPTAPPELISAAGWHAWRPAHLHLKVSAPGHQLVTTQLYFEGGEHIDSDIASAVKPELMIAPPATTTAPAAR